MSRKLIEKTKSLLEAETGTVYKDHSHRLRAAVAFPNTYRLGMSTLGLQIIYRIINDQPDAVAERVFLPDADDIAEYHRTNTRLFTLESQTPVDQFDLFAFSVSFELDYIHLLRMLKLSGIPLHASERDETHPLVIAGGPAVTFNPEPLAEFLDVVVIGEAEEVLPEIIDVLRSHGDKSRGDLLKVLTSVEGVYVPRFYHPHYSPDGTISSVSVDPPAPVNVRRRVVSDLDKFNGFSMITTPNCEFPDMLLTEVMRGCMRQCRFCTAGYTSLPPRPRQMPHEIEGTARLGLVGSAVFDHPDAQSICDSIIATGRDFSVSSIRIETLTPELASMMFEAGQRTMTIAPEAGTERLRRIINKELTDDRIKEAVHIGTDANFSRIKLYYMIGLPGEEDSDVAGIAQLAEELSSSYPRVHFQLSVSCYVPKPRTPFQWCGMEEEKGLSRKLALLKKRLSRLRNVQLTSESPRLSAVQALLARGDRRLAVFLEEAERLDGNYGKAISQAGIDTSFYVTRTRDADEIFPWDHIDLLVKKEYLLSELNKAFQSITTPACKVGPCRRCGVC